MNDVTTENRYANLQALQLAVEYHRINEAGLAVAKTQQHQVPDKASATRVVETAAVFSAFLKGA